MESLQLIITSLPSFWRAGLMTLQITAAGVFIGLFIGLVVGLLRVSDSKLSRYPAKGYIFLIRGTPLLLQLFIIYYGLTSIITIPPFPSAVIALGIHNGAYIAEVFRGAIQSIDKGQMEAARSLGMTKSKAMERIILPQAFKRAIPSLGNQFIIALKDSSLASTIAVSELLLRGRQLGSSSFRYMEMLIVVAIWYLLLTSLFTLIMHRLESHFKTS
ncbi:MAG: amino acid ABC transporter permease [Spirochaetes bacterium]|jgi:polar amino acid transport system permease protein|nr:amino acid ABC transporter permease [Spirochaetota bacterium]